MKFSWTAQSKKLCGWVLLCSTPSLLAANAVAQEPTQAEQPKAADQSASDQSPSDQPASDQTAAAESADATVGDRDIVSVEPETTAESWDASLGQPAYYGSCNPVCGCATASKKAGLTAAMKDAYKGVFYANNFGYLNSPLYDGPFFPGDPLKGLMDGKLDLGGEFRSRYHSENNHRGLGLTGNDDQFWLTRLRLFANYRVNDYLRVYGEYLYADSAGESQLIRPIEENRGDAQNLFAEVKLTDSLSVRAGRQELLLGAQRLISPLDWANTRRTFDGYRATYKTDGVVVDGFYTNPVARVRATGGTHDWDSTNRNQHLYGAYLTSTGNSIGTVETYYLGFDNETANFSFHTLGGRVTGKGQTFLYDFEGGVQFGQNADNSDHGAAYMTAGLGRQLSICDWKPTMWAWYDWASGGDASFVDVGDDGFHHLLPLAHKYNGFMDLFGRRNLNDVNLQFITPLGDKVKFLMWYHYFFLDQATTPFGVTMQPYNGGNMAVSKDLGHEIDCLFTINLNPRNNVLVGYSFFDAGDYYQTPGVLANADADFFYCQFQSRF